MNLNNYVRFSFASLMNNYKSFVRFEFNSAIGLKSLYPNSDLKIITPSKSQIQEYTNDKFTGFIPADKINITYGPSYGPGGHQVYTKVIVKFHVESADWINPELKQRLLQGKKDAINKDGYYTISSDKTRSATLNLADVLQRIRTILYRFSSSEEESKPDSENVIRKRKEKENRERLKMKSFFR